MFKRRRAYEIIAGLHDEMNGRILDEFWSEFCGLLPRPTRGPEQSVYSYREGLVLRIKFAAAQYLSEEEC